MEHLLNLGTSALKKAALNEEAKHYLIENPVLYPLLKKAADRYIGGENLEETLPKVKNENQKGIKCSIEFMGESTRTLEEAKAASDEFLAIAEKINQEKLNSTISLDLSHIGLAISKELCQEHLDTLCRAAGETEVIISAEGLERTDAVIDMYKWGSQQYKNLSITLQAYLHRTKDDFAEVLKEKGRIRIVKGAFDMPENVALKRGDALNSVYLNYVEQLFKTSHLCSIATHDAVIQQSVIELITDLTPEVSSYEFESLYGIQTEQLMALHEQGYPVKLYFVYGKEWYLYLCNRLAEYPLNVFRALNDVVGS